MIQLKKICNILMLEHNGKQVVGIGIYQQSDANTIKVANGIKSKIKEIRPGLPPGTSLEVSFDRSNYIKAAIKEVYKTLFIALILVTIIIYLFLGNIRALVVPESRRTKIYQCVIGSLLVLLKFVSIDSFY